MFSGNSVSVILTIYNKEDIVENVFLGLINSISNNVKEIIIILDGCIDKTEENLKKVLASAPFPPIIIHTPNINETLSNNIGLKISRCKYSIIVQDDCQINEKEFDKRLIKPFLVVPNLLAVSGRDAIDTRLVNGLVDFYNGGGHDANTSRNIFSIRDAINRGPLMLDNEKVKKLDYLDEEFAPFTMDDVDLSIRGYKEFGYLVGSYVIEYISDKYWGSTRINPKSMILFGMAQERNMKFLTERHYDFIVGQKHSQDIIIEE